jgi:hypothetical protein
VDGVESTASLSEILEKGKASKQKLDAADKRLQEAAETKAQWEKALAESKERKQQDQPPEMGVVRPQETDKPVAVKTPATFTEAQWKELARNIQYGDEEEVVTSLKDVLASVQGQPAQTHDEIVGAVEQKMEERELIKLKTKLDKYQTLPADQGGFADLANDPVYLGGFGAAVDAKLRDGENHTFELYQKTADEIRRRFGLIKSEKTAEEKDPRKDLGIRFRTRLGDKKRSIAAPAKGVTAKTTSSMEDENIDPETQYPKTIAEIAKMRGQIIS